MSGLTSDDMRGFTRAEARSLLHTPAAMKALRLTRDDKKALRLASAKPRAHDERRAPAVWTLQSPGGTLLMAGERVFNGARFFELRLYADNGRVPTRKGVTLPLHAVADLAKALTDYAATLPSISSDEP